MDVRSEGLESSLYSLWKIVLKPVEGSFLSLWKDLGIQGVVCGRSNPLVVCLWPAQTVFCLSRVFRHRCAMTTVRAKEETQEEEEKVEPKDEQCSPGHGDAGCVGPSKVPMNLKGRIEMAFHQARGGMHLLFGQ